MSKKKEKTIKVPEDMCPILASHIMAAANNPALAEMKGITPPPTENEDFDDDNYSDFEGDSGLEDFEEDGNYDFD